MKLCLWLYSHRHGTDVLKLLVPDNVEPTQADVIRLTGIDWEGEGSESPRDDEWLQHDVDLPVGDDTPIALILFVSVWA